MGSIEDINRRRAMLKELLNETEGASGAGSPVARRLQDLAEALAVRLGRSISIRSVQRDIAQLQRSGAKKPSVVTFPRGRPRRSSRPGTASRDLVTSVLYEACVLSGLSASAVHALAAASAPPASIPSLATFHLDLDRLRLKPPKRWKVPNEALFDPSHTLKIHQVVLQAPGGRWWVVLLAYDIRSSYVNAAVFDVHPPVGTERAQGGGWLGASVGRPVAKFHHRWRATLHAPGAPALVELCPEAILDFAEDTQSKMVLPVGMLILSKSLGDVEKLCSALRVLSPEGIWVGEADRRIQAPLLQAAVGRSGRLDWKGLASCLNRHNSFIAQPLLKAFRGDIDAAEETGVWPSHRLAALDPFRRSMIPDPRPFTAASRARRAGYDPDDAAEMRRRIADYKNTSPMRAHRGKHLALRPIRIRGSYAKPQVESKGTSLGVD